MQHDIVYSEKTHMKENSIYFTYAYFLMPEEYMVNLKLSLSGRRICICNEATWIYLILAAMIVSNNNILKYRAVYFFKV
jgi:hypothetical protein